MLKHCKARTCDVLFDHGADNSEESLFLHCLLKPVCHVADSLVEPKEALHAT